MKDQGFTLTESMVKDLQSSGVSTPTMIALQKVYGLQGEKSTVNDVKLASPQQMSGKNDLQRPIAQTINRVFSDL